MVKALPSGSPVVTADRKSFVDELEAANLHPLWDRFKKITPIHPQPRDAPLIWRWKDIEQFARARGRRSCDRRRRAAGADSGQSGLCRRDGHDLKSDRRIHGARSRRSRAAAPAYLRRHSVCDAGRWGRHLRQRPPLRHARRRSHSHAADVLARPHQRERSTHYLVRCREYSADPLSRRQFLRARRCRQQRVLARRRRR